MPTELDEQRRKIMQLEIEESALKKETDNLSKERLAELQKELAEMRDAFNTQKAQWDNEKHSVEKLQKLREQIEDINKQIQKASCRSFSSSWRLRRNRLKRVTEAWYMRLLQMMRSPVSFPDGPVFR